MIDALLEDTLVYIFGFASNEAIHLIRIGYVCKQWLRVSLYNEVWHKSYMVVQHNQLTQSRLHLIHHLTIIGPTTPTEFDMLSRHTKSLYELDVLLKHVPNEQACFPHVQKLTCLMHFSDEEQTRFVCTWLTVFPSLKYVSLPQSGTQGALDMLARQKRIVGLERHNFLCNVDEFDRLECLVLWPTNFSPRAVPQLHFSDIWKSVCPLRVLYVDGMWRGSPFDACAPPPPFTTTLIKATLCGTSTSMETLRALSTCERLADLRLTLDLLINRTFVSDLVALPRLKHVVRELKIFFTCGEGCEEVTLAQATALQDFTHLRLLKTAFDPSWSSDFVQRLCAEVDRVVKVAEEVDEALEACVITSHGKYKVLNDTRTHPALRNA